MKEYIIKVDEEKKDIMGGMPLMDKPQELVRCKDCIYYEQKEHWANWDGIPILATEMPTCSKWGDGDCATREDGFCFLAERKTV